MERKKASKIKKKHSDPFQLFKDVNAVIKISSNCLPVWDLNSDLSLFFKQCVSNHSISKYHTFIKDVCALLTSAVAVSMAVEKIITTTQTKEEKKKESEKQIMTSYTLIKKHTHKRWRRSRKHIDRIWNGVIKPQNKFSTSSFKLGFRDVVATAAAAVDHQHQTIPFFLCLNQAKLERLGIFNQVTIVMRSWWSHCF